MKVLVCENNVSGTSSLFLVTNSLGKIDHGDYHRQTECLRKVTWDAQTAVIGRQVVLRNYTEQITEKQIRVKTRTESLNKETHSIYGSRCSFDQKSKGIQKRKYESVKVI